MMEDVFLDCMMHPVKCKLWIKIKTLGQATARQLADGFPEISQATLYRMLKSMVKDGVLKISQENQVRGTLEKTYACCEEPFLSIQTIVKENNGPAYLQLFRQYMMHLLAEFQNYAGRPGIDLEKDGSGFTLAPIYATEEELQEVMQKIGEIVAPLTQSKPEEGRSSHVIGFVVTPPGLQEGE